MDAQDEKMNQFEIYIDIRYGRASQNGSLKAKEKNNEKK